MERRWKRRGTEAAGELEDERECDRAEREEEWEGDGEDTHPKQGFREIPADTLDWLEYPSLCIPGLPRTARRPPARSRRTPARFGSEKERTGEPRSGRAKHTYARARFSGISLAPWPPPTSGERDRAAGRRAPALRQLMNHLGTWRRWTRENGPELPWDVTAQCSLPSPRADSTFCLLSFAREVGGMAGKRLTRERVAPRRKGKKRERAIPSFILFSSSSFGSPFHQPRLLIRERRLISSELSIFLGLAYI